MAAAACALQDVSIIRVACDRLKEALVPAPTTSLAQLHELLPALASELFQVRRDGVGAMLRPTERALLGRLHLLPIPWRT